ncbi:hypothetical protein HYT52_01450 [Candidatus Woesearchaeota archaeon]|nr:hypothetical protein [Candidatus Woesearchaeota archaeon]
MTQKLILHFDGNLHDAEGVFKCKIGFKVTYETGKWIARKGILRKSEQKDAPEYTIYGIVTPGGVFEYDPKLIARHTTLLVRDHKITSSSYLIYITTIVATTPIED